MELIKWSNRNAPSFKNLVDEFFHRDSFAHLGGRTMSCVSPAVNVKETEKNFVIEVMAPGFNKDAFKLEVDAENVLSISAEFKNENEEKSEGRYTRREYTFGNFNRRFTLPENVQSEKIEAVYTDGILSVTLPKKEVELKKTARVINIK